MSSFISRLLIALLIGGATVAVTGCKEEPETLGDKIDAAADDAGDAVDDAADAVGDAVDDAADAVDDALDDG